MKNLDNTSFGRLSRTIKIEVDDRGQTRVTAWDYMLATGTTPENMVMIALPQKRPTDSRLVILQLLGIVNLHLNALFAAMNGKGAPGDGAKANNTNDGV